MVARVLGSWCLGVPGRTIYKGLSDWLEISFFSHPPTSIPLQSYSKLKDVICHSSQCPLLPFLKTSSHGLCLIYFCLVFFFCHHHMTATFLKYCTELWCQQACLGRLSNTINSFSLCIVWWCRFHRCNNPWLNCKKQHSMHWRKW